MPTPLENFRAQYPAYDDLSDAELVDKFHKKYYSDIPRQEFNKKIGYSGLSASPDGVTFSEAVQAGTESLGNSMVALEAGVYDLFGYPEAADAAIGEYYKNQKHIATLLDGATDWRDIANADSFGEGAQRTLDYVMENFGMNSPQMAAILAGGLGTAAITPYTPEPISLAISKLGGFTVGATAVALPMFTGFNVGRQIDEGQDPDILTGAFWSIPQAIVEAKLASVYTTTGLTKVGESVLGKFSNSTATNVAKKMSELVAVGVPSEVIQQAMERTAANLEWNPLQSEEAFNEYVDTAFQAAAAMSPMGSLALLHSDKTTVKDRSEEEKKRILSEETQKIVKKEIENSPEPKRGMFKTAKEAESALKSMGINPDMFDSEAAKVRAANIVVQKIDTNRAKFLEAYNLANPMPQPSFKPASILAEQKTAKVPLGPAQIENLRTDQDFIEFGSLLSSTAIPVYPDVPSLDLSEAPETYSAAVKANQDLRTRMLTSAAGTNKKTISDTPGAIQADFNEMLRGFEKDLKLPATELIKIAVDKFKIPEKDLKDKVGKWLPKQEVANKILGKVVENQPKPKEGPAVNQVPQQPLNKTKDAFGFKNMGNNMAASMGENFINGWYDTLTNGPKKSSVFKSERLYNTTKAAFEAGKIKSPADLRTFLESGDFQEDVGNLQITLKESSNKPAPLPQQSGDFQEDVGNLQITLKESSNKPAPLPQQPLNKITDAFGFKNMGNNMAASMGENFINGWYDTLTNGPKKSSVFKSERLYNTTKAAFEAGKIKSPADLRTFLESKESSNKPAPLPQQPLNKITDNDLKTLEDLFSGAEKSVQIVSEKIKPVIDAMTRISDETGVPLKMKNHLGIDSVTRTFKSAMKAAQAVNKIFTAVNFSDIKSHPNLELNLQEAWAYTFSNLPKTAREAIMAEVPDILSKIPDEAVKKNLELWAKVKQGREEIVSSLFSDYASAVRKKEKFTQPIPKETKAQFDKLIKFLEKSRDSAKGQGYNTFSDLFPSVSDAKTPRDSLFDSVEAMRKERLRSFSDALQFQNWKDISEVDFRKFMDESLKKGVKLSAMEKTSWYTRIIASAVHLASRNPIFAVVQVMRGQQEKLQSKFLTTFSDAGEIWGREPSKEVKIKAAQVLDHLRNTDQRLVKDKDGAIVFERDGQLIRIKHPDMVEVIESLDNLGKVILNAHEGELRAGLNRILKDALIKPLKEIKQDFAKVEKTLSEEDKSFVEDQISVLENIEHLKQFPYVPRSRFGSFGFTVHLKSNLNKDGKVLPNKDPEYHAQVEEGNYKGRWNELQYNEVQEALKEYRGKPEYVIFEDSKDSPYEMTYQNMYDRVSQDSFTLEMIAGLVGADKTEQYFVDVKKKLDQKTRYRGFKRRLAQAKNVKGYSQDWERVISSYTTAAAHFLAQSRYAPLMKEYGEKVDTLSRNQQWVKDKVASYIEYTASPHDSFQNIRSINFSWTMGANISSSALQVMTLPTSSLASMTQYNLNPIKNARLLSKYFGVGVSTILDRSSVLYENGSVVFKIDDPDTVAALKKGGMDDDMIRFMKKAFHENFTAAGTVEELTGKKNYETRSKKGSVKEKVGFITNFLAIPMSLMEQITRFSTVAAHYDMFRNNPEAVKRGLKVLENDYRFQALRKVSGNSLVEDLAFFGLDESHAVFGKTGRSDLLRGGFGAFAFPFATYTMQIVEFMKRMYGRGPEGKMALALMMGSLMFFAGGLGLPGAELLKEIAEEAWKQYEGEEIDIEYLIRQKLTEATGDPRFGQFATQGFFRAFVNLDVSKRIQTPLFGQEWILAMMGVRGDITQIAGVQGSMATNALEAWQAYNRDESGAKIASMLSPTALANLFKAYSYYDEGVSTMNDTQLLTPEQVREHPEQIAFRLLGFSSDMVASAREAQYWAQLEDRRYKPAMDKFRAKAKNYLTKQIRAMNSGNQELADEYREKFAGVMDDIVEFANRKGFLVNVPSLNRSIIDATSQRLEGGLQFEQLSKANRHKKDSIERTAGVK